MRYPLYPQQMMKSLIPCCEYILRMCHRIGRPPISTIGLGRETVSSLSRVPSPPANMTAFIPHPLEFPTLLPRRPGSLSFVRESLPSRSYSTRAGTQLCMLNFGTFGDQWQEILLAFDPSSVFCQAIDDH